MESNVEEKMKKLENFMVELRSERINYNTSSEGILSKIRNEFEMIKNKYYELSDYVINVSYFIKFLYKKIRVDV